MAEFKSVTIGMLKVGWFVSQAYTPVNKTVLCDLQIPQYSKLDDKEQNNNVQN